MIRTWYQLFGTDEFMDADGSIDRPCYGIFPARDTAEDVADYFLTLGHDTEIVEVQADWTKAKQVE